MGRKRFLEDCRRWRSGPHQRRSWRVGAAAMFCLVAMHGWRGTTIIYGAELLEISVAVTNADGNPVTSVAMHEPFQAFAQVQDLRTNGLGVFSAYVDMSYDASIARVDELLFGEEFPNRRSADLSVPGRIEEAGAISVISPNGSGPHTLFQAQMTALQVGLLILTSEPADQRGNELLLYDLDRLVAANETVFGRSTLIVRQTYCDFDLDGRIELDDLYSSNAYPTDHNRCLSELGRLPADADGDGQVQFSDFVALANSFGQTGNFTNGDFDFDHQVQFSDFVILAKNFGRGVTTNGSAPSLPKTLLTVAEPSFSWLVLGGVIALIRHRRR